MPVLSRSLTPALVVLISLTRAEGFSVQDLYEVNYEDPMVGLWCIGLTASGFEQSAGAGRDGVFPVPSPEAIEYFHREGANCFRVPILWERLQSWSNVGSSEFDPVDGFLETIRHITEELKDYAIVVPYQGAFGGFRLEDGDSQKYEATMEDFVSLWTAISKHFAGNDRVIFELYNFPEYGSHKGQDGNGTGYFSAANVGGDGSGEFAEAWVEWCQGALDTIRAQGASNYVLVPGLRSSSCRDWNGAQFWGGSLDGEANTGNLRLFALNDTALRTAYAVHQFFDATLTGNQNTGCKGHDQYEYDPSGYSADEGCLIHTVQMAQKYNKKLWLTETGSFMVEDKDKSPVCSYCAGQTEWAYCEEKMDNFLAQMAASDVFLGYQVWQFGNADGGDSAEHPGITIQDQWDRRPYNLAWYEFEKYGITTTTTTTSTATKTTTTATTSTSTRTTFTSTTVTTSTSTGTTGATTAREEDESGGALGVLPGAGLVAAAALTHLLAC